MPKLELITEIGDGQEILVTFDYTPAEKPILYPNDKADPGCDAEIDITSITIPDSILCFKDELSEETLDHLVSLCFENINN